MVKLFVSDRYSYEQNSLPNVTFHREDPLLAFYIGAFILVVCRYKIYARHECGVLINV